jgi:ankyrin repeat protein
LGDPNAISRLAARGENFTCGPASDPLPLDEAVMSGRPEVVRALLKAHTDPNARWSWAGDRFPLQEAIEARSYGKSTAHGREIIRILLQHGADPNARWCPFESRHADPGVFVYMEACRSEGGVTPLIMAAAQDDAEVVFQLLAAGADPALETRNDVNALDHARGNAVMHLLLEAMFPRVTGRALEALHYLNERQPRNWRPGPWDQLALTRAIASTVDGAWVPPPPPPLAPSRSSAALLGSSPVYRSERVERVGVLFSLGADPNQRVSRGAVDWTPLGLAISIHDPNVADKLLAYGADVNARWCVPIEFVKATERSKAAPQCTRETGMTPLMFAASLGDGDMVALLLKRGADRHLQDWTSRTAFAYAVSAQKRDIAGMLR